MPLVQVFHDPAISREYLRKLKKTLPKSVANNLNCDEADKFLTSADITVIFHPYGPFDVHEKRLEVIITANNYQSRANTLDERAKAIHLDIHEATNVVFCTLSPHEYFVWIVLGNGGFWSVK